MSPGLEAPPRQRRLYLDTSAYLCILLAEQWFRSVSYRQRRRPSLLIRGLKGHNLHVSKKKGVRRFKEGSAGTAIAHRVSEDPISLGADGSILINLSLLPAPEKLYDADISWIRRGRGYVSLFFGKQNVDDLKQLRTRLEVKYTAESFVKHFWGNSREFHEKMRTLVESWPPDPSLERLNGAGLHAERDHSEWANFDYMARSGSHGTIDFFLLPAAGVARFVQGHGSSGLVMVPVVRVMMTIHELSALLDSAAEIVDEVKNLLSAEVLQND